MTARLSLTPRLFLTTRTEGARVRTTGSERSSPSRREERVWAERKLRLPLLFLWSHWLEAAALPFISRSGWELGVSKWEGIRFCRNLLIVVIASTRGKTCT